MKNGSVWQDIDGKDIQAHGGCLLFHDKVYYWYGEHKGADNCPHTTRVDVIGVSCYSSTDLLHWKYEGLVLESEKEDENSPLHTSKVLERPKVLYNQKNKQFVLWMHLDSADYKYAGVGVAVSDTPTGKFKLLHVFRPNNQDSRDMTVYQAADGTAWLFSSTDMNSTMSISRLNDDYTNVDGFYTHILINQEREAPAIFCYENMYYMISSGCTGWRPNPALFAYSPHITGKWKLIDNPCLGKNRETTFLGQSSYIFEAEGRFYLMLDHWQPYDLKNSGYSILPISVKKEEFPGLCGTIHTLTVEWQEEWKGL